MTITNQQAQKAYLEARNALSAIVSSRKATASEKSEARIKRDLLDSDFVGQNLADIEERTGLFERFVVEMKQITERLETNSLVKTIGTLRTLTDEAKALMEGGES